jgi:hypothetical protein
MLNVIKALAINTLKADHSCNKDAVKQPTAYVTTRLRRAFVKD